MQQKPLRREMPCERTPTVQDRAPSTTAQHARPSPSALSKQRQNKQLSISNHIGHSATDTTGHNSMAVWLRYNDTTAQLDATASFKNYTFAKRLTLRIN